MDIALLFNPQHPALDGIYGYAVMCLILGTGVLLASNRHMRISRGDVVTATGGIKSQYDYGCCRSAGQALNLESRESQEATGKKGLETRHKARKHIPIKVQAITDLLMRSSFRVA